MSPAYPDFHKRPLPVQGNSFLVGYTRKIPVGCNPLCPPPPPRTLHAYLRRDQNRSTANEGQSTTAVTRQYRGSALPPDLKKTKELHGRRSSHHPVRLDCRAQHRLILPLFYNCIFTQCPKSCSNHQRPVSSQMSARIERLIYITQVDCNSTSRRQGKSRDALEGFQIYFVVPGPCSHVKLYASQHEFSCFV